MMISKVIQNTKESKDYYEEHIMKKGHVGIVVRTEGVGFKIIPVRTIDEAIIGGISYG
jgi:hypothetical protein